MSYTKGWLNVEDDSTFELDVEGADTYEVSCVIDGLVVNCAPFPQHGKPFNLELNGSGNLEQGCLYGGRAVLRNLR